MFFEEQIRDAIRQVDTYGRWLCVLCFPALAFICAVIAARNWIDHSVGYRNAPEIIVSILMAYMLLTIAWFMVCLELRQRKSPLKCPGCDKDLRSGLQTILLTRSCVACQKQIIQGGKVRRLEVARRYHRRKFDRQQMIMMSGLSPVLPFVAVILMIWEWFTWSEQGRPLIFAPIACIVAFTFALFGYCNWRRWWFVLEMFVAVAVGVFGGWLYWYF